MNTSDEIKRRHDIEESFHDVKAREGVDDFYRFGALEVPDSFSTEILGDLRGKHLLEIGCGDGVWSVQFARAGARVTSIDISREMVELTRRAAAQESVADMITATQMSGEELNFPDKSFDVIFGHSVLHHLDLTVAVPHLQRVLRPNGIAIFLEPLDHNPLLSLFRVLTPRRRTPTERPLSLRQIDQIGTQFSQFDHWEFHFVSLVAFIWYYGFRNQKLFQLTLRIGSAVDSFLFKVMPFLRKYAWVTVVRFVN